MTKTIRAIWKNRQIVPTEPIDLPDGTTLSIEPIEVTGPGKAEEDLSGDDSATIVRRIALFDAIRKPRLVCLGDKEPMETRGRAN